MKSLMEGDVAFSLLAIRSTAPDTRMAWLLNRALHLDFIHYCDLGGRGEPDGGLQHALLSADKPEAPRQFAAFRAANATLNRTYILITNRQNNEPLIKELAHVDYLLKIPEALPSAELAALGAAIRAIPGVLACIDVANILKYNPLLASLEA